LKYISDVDEVMKQVFKVLKKGGRFLIYCLWKSEKYDENIKEHREVINKFEYSCGMPPIHKVTEIIDCAEKNDLKLISKLELSQDEAHSWHTVFSGSKLLMWSMESKLVRYLAYIAECIGLLPQGFDAFMEIFVRGNVLSIVKAAKMGIMSGSEILIFEKQ
jgi:cyclopropane fatty-acyl-phospholipid synthase-like methyltransferase